jgi:peptidoglycan LD-endopeptidase CwlK
MPDPNLRDTDLSHLHPAFRQSVQQVLQQCAQEQLPFRVFEAYRSPHRQAFLYAQGRTRPGSIVTYAQPWSSYHQYGLAADFVLHIHGTWSWDDSGPRRQWWARLHAIGRSFNLEPLKFETPHLQQAGLSVAALRAGDYPPAGDESWAACLEAAIISWNGSPSSPPPPTNTPQRPPLPVTPVNDA